MRSNSRPVLLLPASEDFYFSSGHVLDVFNGPLFRLLRNAYEGLDARDFFKIIVMTNKGFLDCDDDSLVNIDNHDVAFISDRDAVTCNLQNYSKNFLATLGKALAFHEAADCYVVLTSSFAESFLQLNLGNEFRSILSGFNLRYVNYCDHELDLRVPLKSILEYEKALQTGPLLENKYTIKPTVFRSGISSITDAMGLMMAGEPCGGSLFYINGTKGVKTFSFFMEATSHQKFFLDNGLISYLSHEDAAIKKGIKPPHVPTAKETLEHYEEIVDGLAVDCRKNLYIVAPDDPIDQEQALKNILDNKDIIIRLANKTDIMIPVHHCHLFNKTKSYMEHAVDIFEALDWNPNIRLGVPMKARIQSKLGDLPARLPMELLKQVLALKAPTTGEQYIKKVHFLALNEVTPPANLFSDVMVCCESAGVIDVSTDQQRVSAVIGRNKATGRPRKCTKIMDEITDDVAQYLTVNSESYKTYDAAGGFDGSKLDGCCINEIDKNPGEFLKAWNSKMPSYALLDVGEHSVVSSQSVLLAYSCTVCGLVGKNLKEVVSVLKRWFWSSFEIDMPMPPLKNMRFHGLREYFTCNPDINERAGGINFDMDKFNSNFVDEPFLIM